VRTGPLQRRSGNIIVELPGQGENVVIRSAHDDSGVSVLLTRAERLAQSPWSNEMVSDLPFILRSVAFRSEETGLDGSVQECSVGRVVQALKEKRYRRK